MRIQTDYEEVDLGGRLEAPPPGWRRSKRGNLWRKLPDGRTATVFASDRGGFSWCLASGDGPRYSPRRYECEADAVAAAMDEARGAEEE